MQNNPLLGGSRRITNKTAEKSLLVLSSFVRKSLARDILSTFLRTILSWERFIFPFYQNDDKNKWILSKLLGLFVFSSCLLNISFKLPTLSSFCSKHNELKLLKFISIEKKKHTLQENDTSSQ